jgi:hypothetical protein
MDVFDEELINFWSVLNKNHVRYVMLGGVATNLHERLTVDIDVWIEDPRENRKNLRIAFEEYSGIHYFMLEDLQIVPDGEILI